MKKQLRRLAPRRGGKKPRFIASGWAHQRVRMLWTQNFTFWEKLGGKKLRPDGTTRGEGGGKGEEKKVVTNHAESELGAIRERYPPRLFDQKRRDQKRLRKRTNQKRQRGRKRHIIGGKRITSGFRSNKTAGQQTTRDHWEEPARRPSDEPRVSRRKKREKKRQKQVANNTEKI